MSTKFVDFLQVRKDATWWAQALATHRGMRRFVTVREKEGRTRYIAFRVIPAVGKARLLAALRTAPGPNRPWLVDYDGGRGLVRCPHTAKDATVAFLNGLRIDGSRIQTVGASGTIRKARRKYLGPRVHERAK